MTIAIFSYYILVFLFFLFIQLVLFICGSVFIHTSRFIFLPHSLRYDYIFDEYPKISLTTCLRQSPNFLSP